MSYILQVAIFFFFISPLSSEHDASPTVTYCIHQSCILSRTTSLYNQVHHLAKYQLMQMLIVMVVIYLFFHCWFASIDILMAMSFLACRWERNSILYGFHIFSQNKKETLSFYESTFSCSISHWTVVYKRCTSVAWWTSGLICKLMNNYVNLIVTGSCNAKD